MERKVWEALTSEDKSVDFRVWLGDDRVRAELDLRRPVHKRFVLFDCKVRVRGGK